MSSITRRPLHRVHVMTIVAALLAVTAAGAIAARPRLLGSAQVQNNSIAGIDLRNETVTGVDLRNGSIVGRDVKDEDVSSDDVGAGAAGTSVVGAGSVSTSKLADGAVGAVDLEAGAVGTEQLASGFTTRIGTGETTYATNPSDALVVVSAPFGSVTQPAGRGVLLVASFDRISGGGCGPFAIVAPSFSLDVLDGATVVTSAFFQVGASFIQPNAATEGGRLIPIPASATARTLQFRVSAGSCQDFMPPGGTFPHSSRVVVETFLP